jgi:GNAT superfamily N-acetyltransferase
MTTGVAGCSCTQTDWTAFACSAGEERSVAWRQTIQGMSPRDIVRAAFRKFIFRRVTMGVYEAVAAESRPFEAEGCRMELVSGRDVDPSVIANPYLQADEYENLRRRDGASCVLARCGDAVVGSQWVLQRHAEVSDLGCAMKLDEDVHFFCHVHVREDFRGRALMSAMIHHYITIQNPSARFITLVYDWNTASVRNLEKLGWERTGTYSATWVLGFHFTSRRSISTVTA